VYRAAEGRHGISSSGPGGTLPSSVLRCCALALATTALLVSAAQARIPSDFVGITSDELFSAPGAYQDATLGRQHAAGVRLIRQTFNWSWIEYAPGRYDFTRYDAYLARTAAHGVRVLPVLFSPPTWRRRVNGRTACPPWRLSDMAAFAQMLVRRYGSKGSLWRARPDIPKLPIRSWQIWNEPNLKLYWCGRQNARQYTNMLRVVGTAIKRADPSAEIVTAGLPNSKLKTAVPLPRYLRQLYRRGAGRWFDTLAINSYAKDRRELNTLLSSIRRLMNRRRDRRGRIWLTELGWGDTGPRHRFIVGSAGQASRIRSAFGYIQKKRKRLRLRGVVYYSWRDLAPYPPIYKDMWGLHTGLLRRDGTPKPAYTAFVQAVRALR
jgi:hypothetical protein